VSDQRDNNLGGCTGSGWKPGESGNPKGRPKSRPITSAIRELLDQNDGEAIKALAKVGLKAALKGDFRYFKELTDRMDGKVLDRMDVTTNGQSVTGPTLADLPESERAAAVAALEGMKGGPE